MLPLGRCCYRVIDAVLDHGGDGQCDGTGVLLVLDRCNRIRSQSPWSDGRLMPAWSESCDQEQQAAREWTSLPVPFSGDASAMIYAAIPQ